MYKKKKGTDSSDGFVANATPITPVATSDNLSSNSKGTTKVTDKQATNEKSSNEPTATKRFESLEAADKHRKKILRETEREVKKTLDEFKATLSQKSDAWLNSEIERLQELAVNFEDEEFMGHYNDEDNIPTVA
jgi:hypothetical protein